MADIKEPDFHADLEKILGSGGNKKGFELNPFFKLGVFIFLIALSWSIIVFLCVSYINYSNKYDNRTPMGLLPPDFESGASTNSTTSAYNRIMSPA